MSDSRIIMYSDGGARGNPGPAAIGVKISAAEGNALEKEYGKYIGERTNNDAEYEAIIFGLKKIKSLIGREKAKGAKVECRIDSELAVKQLNHRYKVLEQRIQRYAMEIWNLVIDFGSVSFVHIPRAQNTDADRIVNAVLDETEKQKTLL